MFNQTKPKLNTRFLFIRREGILSTPAVSAVIRKREASKTNSFFSGITFSFNFLFSSHFLKLQQANGGFIMSASHNPGGPEYDWGIKVTFLINSHQLEEDSVIFYLMYMLRICGCA